MCTHSNQTTSSITGSYATAHAVCSLTLAVLGTVGNCLSIVLIVRGRLHTTSLAMMLIVDLCVANTVTSVFILPLIGVNHLRDNGGTWLYGNDFCAAYGFIMYVVISSEIGILLSITIHQYLVVVRNVNTQTWIQTQRKLKLSFILTLPWLFSIFVYIFPLTRTWDGFGFEPNRGYCTLLNLSGSYSIKPTLSFFYIMTTAAIIVFCYAQIYWTHHKSRIRTTTSLNEAVARSRNNARNSQLLRMISLIVVNFFITYIPFIVKTAVDPCLKRSSVAVFTVILYVSWSHVATNPFIYALANRQIRSQWRRLLPCDLRMASLSATALDNKSHVTNKAPNNNGHIAATAAVVLGANNNTTNRDTERNPVRPKS